MGADDKIVGVIADQLQCAALRDSPATRKRLAVKALAAARPLLEAEIREKVLQDILARGAKCKKEYASVVEIVVRDVANGKQLGKADAIARAREEGRKQGLEEFSLLPARS